MVEDGRRGHWRQETGAGTSQGVRGGVHRERRCLAWDRAVGRDSVTDGRWQEVRIGSRMRPRSLSQVPE